jgi:GNAT superfamily N-acetyltransferase
MTRPSIPEIRPATRSDFAGIEAVLAANGEPTEPEDGPYPPFLDLLSDHGRLLVAAIGDDVAAFAGTMPAGRRIHLSDLFVRPADQGRGIGRALLDAALGEVRPRTTFSSGDPRALPLYVRAGMAPYWPNLYVEGDPSSLVAPDHLTAIESSGADAAAFEGSAAGIDRSDVYAFATRRRQAAAFVVTRARVPVAAGVVHARAGGRGRWIDRATVGRDVDDLAGTLVAVVLAGARGERVGMCLPGPSPLLPVLLQAGFRIVDRDTFMASEEGLVDPCRVLVDPETA